MDQRAHSPLVRVSRLARQRWTRRLGAAVIIAFALMVAATSTGFANHGDGPALRAGFTSDPVFSYPGGSCRIQANIWIKEYGKHGVQQFKWRFRSFQGDINPASPDVSWLRSVRATSSWFYSGSFPNDGQSYYLIIPYGATGSMNSVSLTVRANMVGIRPSWWQRDYETTLQFGVCRPEDAIVMGGG